MSETEISGEGVQEVENGSICPMREEAGVWTLCIRDACAWWEAADGRCAVLDIAIYISRGK